jgi:hypothetical protein
MSNIISTTTTELSNCRRIEVTVTAEMLAAEIALCVADFYKGNETLSRDELLEKIETLRNNVSENWLTPSDIYMDNARRFPELMKELGDNGDWLNASKNMMRSLEEMQKLTPINDAEGE